MLGDIAVGYYRAGYNCSQCILMASKDHYNIEFCDNCVKMCCGINNGFGFGGMCSVLIACIMVLSSLIPEDIGRNRILFAEDFNRLNGSMYCGKIKADDCETVIKNACNLLEKYIKCDKNSTSMDVS